MKPTIKRMTYFVSAFIHTFLLVGFCTNRLVAGQSVDECNSNPCYGSASCLTDAFGRHSCFCPRGWTGKNCSIDIDDCVSSSLSSCHHGGTCVNTPGSFVCNCVAGYSGERCMNGNWIGNPPTCQYEIKRKSCARPGSIRHGDFEPQGDDFTVGSTVKFFCKNKYRLRGNPELTCKANGQWSPKQQPRCTKKINVKIQAP
ncbi:EGF domain, unclasssified sub [Desmophyllum pertusum]|uniref:EGF domain, unclasssified sub n=1 Tax=Desmophyllum pertusum TaxID=174260 RepID=A0A9W9Z7H4_9CNID|nr:EGF domain, unclasssified sub [Desmophyllum pertusum]